MEVLLILSLIFVVAAVLFDKTVGLALDISDKILQRR